MGKLIEIVISTRGHTFGVSFIGEPGAPIDSMACVTVDKSPTTFRYDLGKRAFIDSCDHLVGADAHERFRRIFTNELRRLSCST